MITRSVVVSLCFVVLRVALALRFFVPFTFSAALYGCSELSALLLTVRGLYVGKVDKSSVGLFLPFLYILPLLYRQTSYPGGLAPLLGILSFVQLVMRIVMLDRVSVGVAVYVRLLSSFPYSLIRHPLALVELLQVSSFLLVFPTTWNLIAGSLVLPAVVLSVFMEEKFLLTVPEYRSYSQRVRYRFIPGIF